jgi:hypothetical protein
MNSKSQPTIDQKVQSFDQDNESALRRIWFLGDVHGDFQHIGPTLEAADQSNALPRWLVFLGDLDIDQQPLREILAPFLAGIHPCDLHSSTVITTPIPTNIGNACTIPETR